MNISIVRYRLAKESIDGHLYIDGQFICDTAENAEFKIPCGTYSVEAVKCPHLKRNISVINISKDVCRNCQSCVQVAEKNEKASMKIINAIYHVIEKGRADGKPEEVYMAEANALEATLPKHAHKEPMPFCPQIKAGNAVWKETDGSIVVGETCLPGMVIKSRPYFEALYERIRKNLDRNTPVNVVITENF